MSTRVTAAVMRCPSDRGRINLRLSGKHVSVAALDVRGGLPFPSRTVVPRSSRTPLPSSLKLLSLTPHTEPRPQVTLGVAMQFIINGASPLRLARGWNAGTCGTRTDHGPVQIVGGLAPWSGGQR